MNVSRYAQTCFCASVAFIVSGCGGGATPELVWGKRGVNGGELVKPRAIAIGPGDRMYIVDWTARIQAFSRDGEFLNTSWTTPDYRNGRSSGLSVDFDGNVVVSDSHYNCVRVYSPKGELLRTIGGELGTKPGQLSYVSDALRDKAGNFYVSEFGDIERISKFDTDGKFVKCWGEPGDKPGQFARIRAMTLGPDGNLYIADRCNHRIQVFTTDGTFVRMFGAPGTGPGELSYPNDVACPPDGSEVLYVVEFGNHRVQKFSLTGESLGIWVVPVAVQGNSPAPGPPRSTVAVEFTCSTATTTACSEHGFRVRFASLFRQHLRPNRKFAESMRNGAGPLVGNFTSLYTVQIDSERLVEHSLRECGSGRAANGSSCGMVSIDLLKQAEPPSRIECSTKKVLRSDLRIGHLVSVQTKFSGSGSRQTSDQPVISRKSGDFRYKPTRKFSLDAALVQKGIDPGRRIPPAQSKKSDSSLKFANSVSRYQLQRHHAAFSCEPLEESWR